MSKGEELISKLETKQTKFQNSCAILLISIIPFMILEILTHKLIFIEYSLILFLYTLYNIKQLLNLNNSLELIKETKNKLQKTNIKKVYPKGHHIIANPNNEILNLEAYVFIGTDNGIKLYQNITEIIVSGTRNPNNGQITYDEYGIPQYLINN